MMKKYFLLFTLLTSFAGCTSTEQKEKPEYLSHIGDTSFMEEVDKDGPQPCHPDIAFQYYHYENTGFKEEKPAIERYFKDRFKAGDNKEENGYFTVRFIVNCEGKSSWFRTEAMDLNYQPKQFTPSVSDQLLQLTKGLEGWKVAEHDQRTYDYYQYLTFKIENGQLTEILP